MPNDLNLNKTMKKMIKWRGLSLIGACLLLGLLGACTTAKNTGPKKHTFFPPAPDEPRIQFLTAIDSEADLGRKRSFSDYIIGEHNSPVALVKPYGLAVHDGKIFVCDTVAGVIAVFDLKKSRASIFAPPGEGRLRLPVNLSIDQDGTRYVADTSREQVLIYGPDGSYLEALGKKDEMKPADVLVSSNRLYIADIKNHCVKVLNKADHQLLFAIPLTTNALKGKLFSPTNLALDQSGGRLLVSDTGGNAVQVYDLDGKYLRTIGAAGAAPGLFARPKGVAVDRQGLAYVVDAATQLIQIFDAEGRLLLFFGQAGASTQGELTLPASVKVDYENVRYFQKYAAPGREIEYLILATSQFGGQKVCVYGFLKPK